MGVPHHPPHYFWRRNSRFKRKFRAQYTINTIYYWPKIPFFEKMPKTKGRALLPALPSYEQCLKVPPPPHEKLGTWDCPHPSTPLGIENFKVFEIVPLLYSCSVIKTLFAHLCVGPPRDFWWTVPLPLDTIGPFSDFYTFRTYLQHCLGIKLQVLGVET